LLIFHAALQGIKLRGTTTRISIEIQVILLDMENTMLRLVSLLFVTLVLLSCQALAQAPNETADHQAIQGTWQLDTFHVNGEQESANLQYTFIKDKLSVIEPKLGIVDAQYLLNPSVSPHQVDMLFKAAGGEIMHWRGLYALEKNQLVLCFTSSDGGKRPKALVKQPQQGMNVMILKR
jgi:uncharacterized protein (TIGR03067 family)